MQLLQEMNLRAIVAGLSEINLGLIQYFPGFNFFYGLDITFQYFILKRDPQNFSILQRYFDGTAKNEKLTAKSLRV
jgi:hypothetical protein